MIVEIKDHSKQCRICLSDDNLTDIISPCFCNGSSAFIHRTCLDRWRSENINGSGFEFCNVCQFKYVIESVADDPEAERQRLLKYNFFVIRDASGAFLVLQLVIYLIAIYLQWIDKDQSDGIKNLFPGFFNDFLVYYISAFVLLLIMIGFITYISICITGRGSNCSDCDFNSGGKGIVILLIFFALLGLGTGIMLTINLVRTIMRNHSNKLWLRQEAKKYIVKDFQGGRAELEQYRRPLRYR